MANEITLKTRLLNLYEDSTTSKPRFNSSSTDENIKLKKGEILFHEEKVATDNGEVPVVLMKVGDGATTNDKLNVVAARAADVYAWAKKARGEATDIDYIKKTKVYDDEGALVETKEESITTQVAIDALYEAVATLSGDSGASIAELITRIGTIEADYLKAAALAPYAKTADLASYTLKTELNDYKEEVTSAVADAKKAGTEAKAYAEGINSTLTEEINKKANSNSVYTKEEIEAKGYALDSDLEAEIDRATKAEAKAYSDAKAYVDGLFDKANLDQYTTEEEVKSVINSVIAEASDGTTYDNLVQLVDYIDAHGGEAAEMASAIEVLEGKVETIEGKPAYDITTTQIANWDNEVGAKEIANSKTTTAEVKTQIEAYGYATTSQVATAKTEAVNTVTGTANDTETTNTVIGAKKYADKLNTAMNTRVAVLEAIDHDAYKAADTALHTAITAEIDADVKALADGAVKTNTDAIATLNGKVDVAKVSTAIANAKTEAISEADSKANKAKTDAIATAAADATTKANTAKSEAINAASADATSKANTAETNAKTYADGLNTAMDARVDALESKEDKDTTYSAGDGLALNGTVFSIADSSTGFTFILDANA